MRPEDQKSEPVPALIRHVFSTFSHLGLKSEKLVVLSDALLPPLFPDAFLERLCVPADADADRNCVDTAAVSFFANFFSSARVSTTGRNFLTSPGNKIATKSVQLLIPVTKKITAPGFNSVIIPFYFSRS